MELNRTQIKQILDELGLEYSTKANTNRLFSVLVTYLNQEAEEE